MFFFKFEHEKLPYNCRRRFRKENGDHRSKTITGIKETERCYHSVGNGLFEISQGSLTGIHDGVRPLVSTETIRRCYEEAERKGNAIPAIQPNESVRMLTGTGNRAVNRDEVLLIQTPQVFRWEQLENAYEQDFTIEFTDDASVDESYGFSINIVEGNPENIKITTPEDLKIAEMLV